MPSDREQTLVDTGATEPSALPGRALRPGMRAGRYVLEERLGAGAMGVVFRARDPELDRTVAVKLVWLGRDETAAARATREARALARVAHPNVVAVFDVGAVGEHLFIAMELIAGPTLRAWLHERRRAWRELVPVFRKIGAGLAAAHRAGLVHRDFKPANALIGGDGRARVVDFGIARAIHLPELAGDAPVLSATATRTGSIVGTPAYMAPEQLAGGEVDARADQFALCVCLYEALYGERPFPDHTRDERRPVPAARVPRWLRAVVERGLALDPAERFASIDELLRALRRGERRRGYAAAAAGAGAAAIALALAWPGAPAERACRGSADRLAEVWGAVERDALRAALAGVDRPHAADTAARVVAELDDYASTWQRDRTAACEATRVHQEQSAAVMELRMRCYDRRLASLGALVDVLGTPDAAALDRAVAAARRLPAIAECADTEAMEHRFALPRAPDERERALALTAAVDRAEALEAAGRYAEALAAAQPVADDELAAAVPALGARALLVVGMAHSRSGAADDAREALHQAARAAARARDQRGVARAWIQLIYVVGSHLARPDEALGYRRFAEDALALAGDPAGLRADYHNNVGSVQLVAGALDDADASYRAALAAARGDTLREAQTLNNLGLLELRRGDVDGARRDLARAVELLERALGASHPHVAIAVNNLGQAHHVAGDVDAARASYQRALELARAAHGEAHPDVGGGYNNLGELLRDAGEVEAAGEQFRRALAIWQESFGDAHPVTQIARINLGELAVRAGDGAAAVELCGRADEALRAALGEDHADRGFSLTCVGGAYRLAGRRADAVAALERALALRAEGAADPLDRAHTQLALARALGRGARARELAQKARDGAVAGRGPRAEWLRAEAEAFLGSGE